MELREGDAHDHFAVCLVHVDFDPLLAHQRIHQQERVLGHGAHIGGLVAACAPTREVQELANDASHGLALTRDDERVLFGHIARVAVLSDQLGMSIDHVEWSAQLVRDSRGERADGREAVGMA